MYSKNTEVKTETTEEFLTRGGKITKIVKGDSYKRKTRRKTSIDAQALYNAAVGTPQEDEVVAFLKSQGVEVG